MVTNIRNRLVGFFTHGNERTLIAKRNIAVSFFTKTGNILIGLLLIPATIGYVSPAQYGIWLTISSVVGWLNFFDVGLGNGLRNELTHALAVNKLEQARAYIGTTYILLSLIAVTLLGIFSVISPAVDWHGLLNVSPQIESRLGLVVLLVVGCFCTQFIVQTINVVLIATHQSGKASVISLTTQALVLAVIYYADGHWPGNLTTLVTIVAGTPALALLAANMYFFRYHLNHLTPIFRLTDLRYSSKLLRTGGVFFLIQIGALILFQTDNIIISRLLGPEHVTTFSVAYKLFSVVIMAFSIIMTPLWSAFTDAYAKEDFDWLQNSLYKMRRLWLYASGAAFLILLMSPYIYASWLGERVQIPFLLSVSMAVYVMAHSWQMLHVYLLNGIGKVRLQLILVTISSVLNIPLAIVLGRAFGLAGIISANTVFFVIMGLIFSVQCEKVTQQRANGLWNR